jgi:phosphoadenosine phosphosulfate reductase
VEAVITGRRQSQGADRAQLQPIEIDSTGLINVNPLCRWSFEDVKEYIDLFAVPSNELLDQGYKSVGDWHSTKVPVEGQDERAGRWSGNAQKTECGLHKDYFKMYATFLRFLPFFDLSDSILRSSLLLGRKPLRRRGVRMNSLKRINR